MTFIVKFILELGLLLIETLDSSFFQSSTAQTYIMNLNDI